MRVYRQGTHREGTTMSVPVCVTAIARRSYDGFWIIDSPQIPGMRIWARWLDKAETPIRRAARAQGIDVETITFRCIRSTRLDSSRMICHPV